MKQDAKTAYGRYWDYYVEKWTDLHSQQGKLTWPGDEWGNAPGWDALFQQLFVPAGVQSWERAIEIGPGSGKYTLKVIQSSDKAVVRGYDVSARFLEVCTERCSDAIAAGRLSLQLLDGGRPDEMLNDVVELGWGRQVDGFFSINAMVHVDLQYLIVYLVTAGLALKPGGKLVLTLADVTNDEGFEKLLRDISWTYPAQGRPLGSGKFEWLSPDIVRSLMPRLGFELDLFDDRQRDIYLVATLADPGRADGLRRFITPQP